MFSPAVVPHVPYLSILSLMEEPSAPVCPVKPEGPVSATWSAQAFAKPFLHSSACVGVAFFR